ncbi:sigma-70 family RNA polymerase sigma factor [Anaerotignum sp.]|uniref:sigma-70 family RNA polymerase sigma factor n=1 Tax=Anaerotignum sp. TaxID=2039241 RepID=UPI00332DFC58
MKQELFSDNMDLAYFILRKYFPWYKNDEDARQICLIGLWKASEKFDPGKGYEFSTFASTVIMNQMRVFLRDERKRKRIQYTDSVVYYDGEEVDLIESIPDKYAGETSLDFCFKELSEKLNDKETRVLQMKIKGYNQVEIAKRLNISQPTVARYLRQIKSKV